jgi:hypothetical protein
MLVGKVEHVVAARALAIFDSRRYWKYRKRLSLRSLVRGRNGRRRSAQDALAVQREARHEHIRQLDRADAGRVADTGPAIDQNEVILFSQCR